MSNQTRRDLLLIDRMQREGERYRVRHEANVIGDDIVSVFLVIDTHNRDDIGATFLTLDRAIDMAWADNVSWRAGRIELVGGNPEKTDPNDRQRGRCEVCRAALSFDSIQYNLKVDPLVRTCWTCYEDQFTIDAGSIMACQEAFMPTRCPSCGGSLEGTKHCSEPFHDFVEIANQAVEGDPCPSCDGFGRMTCGRVGEQEVFLSCQTCHYQEAYLQARPKGA